MDHLDEITVEELQDALHTLEGNKPTQRLLAAIAYKTPLHKLNLSSGTVPAEERSTAC